MNRRDLIKYFAAGTVIAPLGSTVVAKLIEVPNIEPVTLATAIDPRQIRSFSVNLEMLEGTVKTIPCRWAGVYPQSDRLLAGDVAIDVKIQAVLCKSPLSLAPIVNIWGQSKA